MRPWADIRHQATSNPENGIVSRIPAWPSKVSIDHQMRYINWAVNASHQTLFFPSDKQDDCTESAQKCILISCFFNHVKPPQLCLFYPGNAWSCPQPVHLFWLCRGSSFLSLRYVLPTSLGKIYFNLSSGCFIAEIDQDSGCFVVSGQF